VTLFNRLPTDPEKRRNCLGHRRDWIERQQQHNPRHARLYCPAHVNYIGHNGVFPCQDCAEANP
jgi:hypothetical protein